MLLQTNSYLVPKDKRSEHARLMRRFKQCMSRLGCDDFGVYEQAGSNWGNGESTGRFVQIMQFRDRRHQWAVQAAERQDPGAEALIAEFCEIINFPYQQQQGLFVVGFYTGVLPPFPHRTLDAPPQALEPAEQMAPSDADLAPDAQPAAADAADETPDPLSSAEEQPSEALPGETDDAPADESESWISVNDDDLAEQGQEQAAEPEPTPDTSRDKA